MPFCHRRTEHISILLILVFVVALLVVGGASCRCVVIVLVQKLLCYNCLCIVFVGCLRWGRVVQGMVLTSLRCCRWVQFDSITICLLCCYCCCTFWLLCMFACWFVWLFGGRRSHCCFIVVGCCCCCCMLLHTLTLSLLLFLLPVDVGCWLDCVALYSFIRYDDWFWLLLLLSLPLFLLLFLLLLLVLLVCSFVIASTLLGCWCCCSLAGWVDLFICLVVSISP